MLVGWRHNRRATLLLCATVATVAWSLGALGGSIWESRTSLLVSNVADVLRYAFWFLFLASLLQGGQTAGQALEAAKPIGRWATSVAVVAIVASLVFSSQLQKVQPLEPFSQVGYGLRLGLAIFGLTLIEQLVRRVHPTARWGIKPLCIALGAVFCFDLFMYSEAMLYSRLNADIWAARGLANAMVIPLLAVATARNTGWTIDMHLSRQAVMTSTALMLSGLFLLAVAIAAYFVRFASGNWGLALQIELIFAALLFATLLMSSGRFRSYLRVSISKHFFSYRYDYRKEWLRFTDTLSSADSGQRFEQRAIMAIGDLVESPSGLLWLRDEAGSFKLAARWNLPAVDAVEAPQGSLPQFLQRTQWIVDLREYREAPEQYAGLEVLPWLQSIPNAWLVVPLLSEAELTGFIVLTTPRTAIEVNWEVRDLLKTASHQAASYLGQMRASEALLEARKFEAFNRMSAFVVHDLKNLIAQLSLMMKNAERHRDNPDFQRDALSTVEHVVGRMNKLMLQLKSGATPVENPRPVDLGALVQRVCATRMRANILVASGVSPGVMTLGDEERLEYIIGHLVQNAIDATSSGGNVEVDLERDDRFAVVVVTDTGTGMSVEFVRDRLFKPFETTKQTGMGIGVYESVRYVRELGGDVSIDSAPGVGTTVRVRLPRIGSAALPPASLREVA
jgi:putative PEP-CTERM system histidine kinase